MAQYADLGHGVYCIDALYIKPQVASIYLLHDGDEAALIETGTRHSLDNVLATLAELEIDAAQIKYVIPTHVHLDHAGGAGAMMARFAEASLIVHPRGARHMIDPQRLIDATIGVYGEEYFSRLYGEIEAIPEARVIVADDPSSFTVGSRELLFFDTPGHARHHFCIYDARSRGVFTGDTFGISYAPMKNLTRGLLPTTPPTQFEPEALHASVERIMSYAPQKLYLTHYGEFIDPAAQIPSFDRWIDAYVELCASCGASGNELEDALESALNSMVLQELDAGREQSLARVLAHDLKLNAQGLAYWWRRQADG